MSRIWQMWEMIERGDRTRLQHEALAVLVHQPLDRDDAVEARIAGFPNFPHPARAKRCQNFVRAEMNADSEAHDDRLADYSGRVSVNSGAWRQPATGRPVRANADWIGAADFEADVEADIASG